MTKRRLLPLLVLGTLGVVVAGLRISSAEEELDPLKVCKDTQKLVLENQFVRVIEERLPPGGEQAKHRHPHGLTIALSDYDNEGFSFTTNQKTKVHRKMGEVNWADPVVHVGKNVGTTEQHVIRIELK